MFWDHVKDALTCLRTALDLLRPGGHFLFGQDLSDLKLVGKHEWFDEGHPIRLTLGDVEPHLAELEPLVNRVLTREESRDPRLQTGVLIFAGRKPPNPRSGDRSPKSHLPS